MDDGYFTLVDGWETIPMAVWVTHPHLRPPSEGGDSLGTGGFGVPSVTKVIHSLCGWSGGRFKCRLGPVE